MLRNPEIANLLQRIDYIEKMGTGIERIKLALKKASVPSVKYEITQSFFRIVFKRASETTQETTQEMILRLIISAPAVTQKELARQANITADGVKYHLNILKKTGRIKHIGPTKKGRWIITNK